jgi:hypothetical protein
MGRVVRCQSSEGPRRGGPVARGEVDVLPVEDRPASVEGIDQARKFGQRGSHVGPGWGWTPRPGSSWTRARHLSHMTHPDRPVPGVRK